MRGKGLAFAVVCLVGLAGLPDRSLGQERWAAVDPNNEDALRVVWDATKEGVRQKAVDACKQVSRTCAGNPAHTDTTNHVFAYMCCTKPRLGCAIGVGDRPGALTMVRKIFSDAGFSRCTLKHYLSAETGNRLN